MSAGSDRREHGSCGPGAEARSDRDTFACRARAAWRRRRPRGPRQPPAAGARRPLPRACASPTGTRPRSRPTSCRPGSARRGSRSGSAPRRTSSPPPSRAAAISSPAGTPSSTTNAKSSRSGGYVIDVAVENPLRHLRRTDRRGRARTRSTRRPGRAARTARPTRLDRRADGRAGERLRALEARLDMQRGEHRLDRALGAEEVAAEDAAQPPPLLRHRGSLTRQIDVRDLEQRRIRCCRCRRSGAPRRAARSRASCAAAAAAS